MTVRTKAAHEKDLEIGIVYFTEIQVFLGKVYFYWEEFILVRHSRKKSYRDKKVQRYYLI